MHPNFRICCCCDSKVKDNGTDNESKEVSPPVTVQPTVLENLKSFEEECLDEHNRLRALHGCPPLKLNHKLSAYAAEWARTLAEQNLVLEYRPEARYGENLFVAREYNVDARIVVKSWYDEIWLYNFNKPGYVQGVDHFTQVIWRDTKQLGVSIRKRGGTAWIVVNYDPMGNIIGEFEHNVPRPLEL